MTREQIETASKLYLGLESFDEIANFLVARDEDIAAKTGAMLLSRLSEKDRVMAERIQELESEERRCIDSRLEKAQEELSAEQSRHATTVQKWAIERKEMVDELVRERAELSALKSPAGDVLIEQALDCKHAHSDDCRCRSVLAHELRAQTAKLAELKNEHDRAEKEHDDTFMAAMDRANKAEAAIEIMKKEMGSDRTVVDLFVDAEERASKAEAELSAKTKELEICEGLLREESAQNEKALTELAELRKELNAFKSEFSEMKNNGQSAHDESIEWQDRAEAAEAVAKESARIREDQSCEFCEEGAKCCEKFDNSYGEMLRPLITVCTACWNKSLQHDAEVAARAVSPWREVAKNIREDNGGPISGNVDGEWMEDGYVMVLRVDFESLESILSSAPTPPAPTEKDL